MSIGPMSLDELGLCAYLDGCRFKGGSETIWTIFNFKGGSEKIWIINLPYKRSQNTRETINLELMTINLSLPSLFCLKKGQKASIHTLMASICPH